MSNIKVDFKYTNISQEEIIEYQKKITKIHENLHKIADNEKEFCGWLNLPINYNIEEFNRIKEIAKKIKEESEILLVIGIGGSYLGARAIIEALTHNFNNLLTKEKRKSPQILFVGQNLSPNYINDLLEIIENKDVSINVISKSGTTTEPAIAFRIFKEFMEKKYGNKEARNRIYVTTDKERGVLKTLALKEGYETFIIPDNIGGRYSVLTAVGLLPICVAGINIEKLLKGAKNACLRYNNANLENNECYQYSVIRNILYKRKKNIEILVDYEPKLHYLIEWWKQLFGESEGKNLKGIFPAGAEFSTDLHSLGQYIQNGRRNIFETTLNIITSETNIKIKNDSDNLDGLNYLKGKTLDYINKKAIEGTIEAHIEDDVPNIVINIEKLTSEALGELIYFFELSCAVSAKLLGVDPFTQPGVEKYKTNMFKLLEKPGFKDTKNL